MGVTFELPATFEMEVWFVDDQQVGKVKIDLPVGKFPTKENILKQVQEAVDITSDTGLHLCSPHEFGKALIYEKTGQKMAIPGPNKWDEPALQQTRKER